MNIRTTFKRHRDSLVMIMITAVIFLGLAVAVVPAHAFNLRPSQAVFNTGSLQGVFNSLTPNPEPVIAANLLSTQLDAQVWSSNSTNADFTLTKKNGVMDEIGVYNSNDPVPNLFTVFPAGAAADWSAHMSFISGGLRVSLFDENGAYQGQTTYASVNRSSFGFYVKSVNGVYYTQDGRNGGTPMVMTYAGVSHFGDWFLCFQDAPYPVGDRDYSSAVLEIQSVQPVPALNSTWGNIKSRYR